MEQRMGRGSEGGVTGERLPAEPGLTSQREETDALLRQEGWREIWCLRTLRFFLTPGRGAARGRESAERGGGGPAPERRGGAGLAREGALRRAVDLARGSVAGRAPRETGRPGVARERGSAEEGAEGGRAREREDGAGHARETAGGGAARPPASDGGDEPLYPKTHHFIVQPFTS